MNTMIELLRNPDSRKVLSLFGLEAQRSRGWRVGSVVGLFGLGALAGAIVGLMIAPASGEKTAALVKRRLDHLATRIGKEVSVAVAPA